MSKTRQSMTMTTQSMVARDFADGQTRAAAPSSGTASLATSAKRPRAARQLLLVVALAMLALTGCGGTTPDTETPPSQLTPVLLPDLPGAAETPAQLPDQPGADSAPVVAPQGRVVSEMALPEEVVLLGWLYEPEPVYALPEQDSQPLGEANTGRVLVTSVTSGWYEIVYGDSADGHAWIPQARVRLLSIDEGLSPKETAQPETASPIETPQPQATETPAPSTQGTVLAARLNVRQGPGTGSTVVGQLNSGDRVDIVGREAGWLEIMFPPSPAGQAWISSAYVAVDGEPAPVVPQGASLPGRLVFQTHNGGDIYVIDGDGTGLRRLTTGFEPALSPDGLQVAFTRWDEPRGLWVINVDESGERHLFTANRARSPTWIPDGSAIVFERNTGSSACYSSPFGCFTEAQFRDRFGDTCIDTPFGRFCINQFPLITQHETTLSRYSLADGSNRDLPSSPTARAPFQDPSSDRVLYLDNEGMATTRNAGDADPRRLVEESTLGPGSISPDGQFFYASRRSHDRWEIWRWRQDGSQATLLTPPPLFYDKATHNVAPSISPDGRSLVFLTDRRGPWELWRMGNDGSNPQPFAPAALAGITFRYDFADDRMIHWGR